MKRYAWLVDFRFSSSTNLLVWWVNLGQWHRLLFAPKRVDSTVIAGCHLLSKLTKKATADQSAPCQLDYTTQNLLEIKKWMVEIPNQKVLILNHCTEKQTEDKHLHKWKLNLLNCKGKIQQVGLFKYIFLFYFSMENSCEKQVLVTSFIYIHSGNGRAVRFILCYLFHTSCDQQTLTIWYIKTAGSAPGLNSPGIWQQCSWRTKSPYLLILIKPNSHY